MKAEKQARRYRLLAWRMRVEAEAIDGIASDRRLETARAFEKIAEQFEAVAREAGGEDHVKL